MRSQDPYSKIPVSFKIRCFNSKAAALILLIGYTAYFTAHHLVFEDINLYYYGPVVLIACPFTGLLADVYFGRYKVVIYSTRILWITLVLHNLLMVIREMVGKFPGWSALLTVLSVIEPLAMSGILSNSLQFGLDQLPDASTSAVTSYINWNTWVCFLAGSVYVITQWCNCGFYTEALSYILQPLMCTVILLADFFASHWLVKEPVTHNPLKLIYQVIRYAVKNKHPRLRSAFTYWEDKPYTRLDLGKVKFGGPFTTEQVEDVKTFFRLVAVMVAGLPWMTVMASMYTVMNTKLVYYYEDKGYIPDCSDASATSYLTNCYQRMKVQFLDHLVVVLLVPVVEFILYPLQTYKSCCLKGHIMQKLVLGATLLLLHAATLLSMEVAGGHFLDPKHNATCMLVANKHTASQDLTIKIPVTWLALPQVMLGISAYLLHFNMNQFIIAQTPYSMRGLLVGLSLFLIGVAMGVSEVALKSASKTIIRYLPDASSAHCGLLYYACMVLLTAAVLCEMILIKRCYRYRRRDEDIHNHQIFAVEYYDKYLSTRS